MRSPVAVVHGDQVQNQVLHVDGLVLEFLFALNIEQRPEFVAVIGDLSQLPVLARFRVPLGRVRVTDAALPYDAPLAEIVEFGGQDDGFSQLFIQKRKIRDYLLSVGDHVIGVVLPGNRLVDAGFRSIVVS